MRAHPAAAGRRRAPTPTPTRTPAPAPAPPPAPTARPPSMRIRYVIGAISLYLDFVNLFIFILQLLSGGERQ